MKYIVIDNFFGSPEAERTKALTATYGTVEHDGMNYPGISVVEDPTSLAKIQSAINCDPPTSATVTYRQYLPKDEQATFIHNDSLIGTISAIAFLTKDEDAKNSGLAFWRHNETGWEGQPTVEQMGDIPDTKELWHRIHQEGMNPANWTLTDFVPMKFNRCVVFLSKTYHSRYPKEPIGPTIDSSRLIKVFFYKI